MIKIKQADIETIEQEGEATYPNECCGFMLGTAENGDKLVTEIRPALNAREEEAQHNRFQITPDNFRETEAYAKEKSLDIVGIYHSHPDHPARPSETDRENAWPWYSYVIVSIMERQAKDMTSWILKDDRSGYDEEEIKPV